MALYLEAPWSPERGKCVGGYQLGTPKSCDSDQTKGWFSIPDSFEDPKYMVTCPSKACSDPFPSQTLILDPSVWPFGGCSGVGPRRQPKLAKPRAIPRSESREKMKHNFFGPWQASFDHFPNQTLTPISYFG